MPFEEININAILEDKFINEPGFKEEFKEAQEELDIILAITRARKLMGLTQEQVAEKAGVKQQVISRLEKRENSPSLKTLIKISKVLGLKLELISSVK